MFEIIFKAPDADFLASEAVRLGFMDDNGNVITSGTFAGGGGWGMAIAGTIYEPVVPPANPEDPWPEPVARPGYWGRLRINGTPESMPPFSPEIVQYRWDQSLGPVDPDLGIPSGAWTDDGVTAAPEWVGSVACIL